MAIQRLPSTPTETRRSSPPAAAILFRIASYGCLGLCLALCLGACGASAAPAPPSQAAPDGTLETDIPVTTAPRAYRSIPLEAAGAGAATGAVDIRFGDLRGDRSPEVALVASGFLTVVDLAGTDPRVYPLPPGSGTAAVLYDQDRDGKLDLLFGSSGESNPSLQAINGTGVLINRRTYLDEAAGALVPLAFLDDSIVCLLRERTPSVFRGVLFIDRDTFAVSTRLAVPGDPTGLFCQWDEGTPLFTVSSTPRQTGMFPYLGAMTEERYGIDASAHLIRFDGAGNLICALPVGVEGPALVGDGRFTALSADPADPVLFDTFAVDTPSPASAVAGPEAGASSMTPGSHVLVLVDPTDGRAIATYRHRTLARPDLRIVRGPAGTRIILLSQTGSNEWDLRSFSPDLVARADRRIMSPLVVLGPVVGRSSDSGGTHVLMGSNSGLALLDADLDESWSVPGPVPTAVAVAEYEGVLRIAAVAAGRLQLYRLPGERAARAGDFFLR